MENVNPLPTNNRHVLPDVLRSIERFLNRFANQPNETSINDPESDDGLVDTPIVPPFPHSDNDSDDEEVLNRLRKNLVAIVRDVYVFVESFTYITDFVVLEDIGEFNKSDMAMAL
ncbi:hypothetical protein Tco_0144234 [Tanacetum coccineum]